MPLYYIYNQTVLKKIDCLNPMPMQTIQRLFLYNTDQSQDTDLCQTQDLFFVHAELFPTDSLYKNLKNLACKLD